MMYINIDFLESSFLMETFNKLCDKAKQYLLNCVYELIRTDVPENVMCFISNCDNCDIKSLSPIEQIFTIAFFYILTAKRIENIKLYSQYKVNSYRLDFYLEVKGKKYAIELDGYDYHSTKKQMQKDYERENNLKELGYSIIRFTGSQVYNTPFECVEKVLNIIENGEKEIRDE